MIGVSRENAVVTLELQRHEKRNALNTELCNGIREGIAEAIAGDARAVVITGAGTAFCAGADLSGDAYAASFPEALVNMLRAIESAPMPVIAAINGPAVGAGCQLALACDLRAVAPEGSFEVPVARVGLALDNWSIKRLSALVGGGFARSILLGAERIGAERALAVGLANRGADLAAAQQWAAELAGLAPLTMRHLKLVLNDDHSHDEPTDDQFMAFCSAWSSEDVKEARRARAEKRAPAFQGR
ncbi:enoyl-CoA hydratase [Speluncibacter jeojiensis]|uniref:Enoyl-CoA hydratase n=1 Tax=Speluncibacter jeojiensis TaxID=2710754 RepID=A0A9X4M395_9ACTN|nr:enoyl-CoA hydratase [Corynebacteriales bacterium D3-21]